MTSLPLIAQSEPLGIVIRSGAPKPKPVRFWAYLWATDDDDNTHDGTRGVRWFPPAASSVSFSRSDASSLSRS